MNQANLELHVHVNIFIDIHDLCLLFKSNVYLYICVIFCICSSSILGSTWYSYPSEELVPTGYLWSFWLELRNYKKQTYTKMHSKVWWQRIWKKNEKVKNFGLNFTDIHVHVYLITYPFLHNIRSSYCMRDYQYQKLIHDIFFLLDLSVGIKNVNSQ